MHALALALTALLSQPAPTPSTQPGPPPAKAQAAATKTATQAVPVLPASLKKVSPQELDAALKAYFANDPRTASATLFGYVETNPVTDENHAWAQYFLARVLIDLDLRHAGAVYLARIARERSNPATLPRALETLRQLTDLPHDEAMIDEQVFGAIDLGFLPDEISDYAHFQQGLVDLKVGNERWSETHFSKLVEGSPESSRAKYATLVNRLRVVRGVPTEMIEDFNKLADDEKLSLETRNEARLAVARLKYEKEDYEGALAAYAKVELPPLDPGRATLYLEEAWTRYRLNQLHAAMGLLTTLDAPSFRDEFTPDKYLLRAMIYRDLCHYLPAKRAAKELTRRFAESLEAVREREDLTQDLRLSLAAAATGPTKRAAGHLKRLQRESEQLGKFAGSFGERLYSHLTKLYQLALGEAQRQYELRLNEAVRDQADVLVRAAEQVRLMEYEVGLKLYERVKKGSKRTALIEEPPLAENEVAFRFDGEYWNDELRDYRVSLPSRCIQEALQ
ncbi:MAG: tetratricopeptide repeat protein [Myxococcaceae bacterium]